MSGEVVVIIGVGGMGEAIARRQGSGRKLMVADFNSETLQSVSSRLSGDGYEVSARQVDVGSDSSVRELAREAASAGTVTQVVHTAGLSPTQANAEAILRVDLYGVAAVLDEFGEVIAPGGAGVVIASMAGHLIGELPSDQQKALSSTTASELLDLPFLHTEQMANPGIAYAIAKRANRLRVGTESVRWGGRGARLNSISPGIIATPMGREELEGESGQHMRSWIEASGTGRIGTPADIVNAAAFLLGPESSFITGTDLLVDGGVVAALTSR